VRDPHAVGAAHSRTLALDNEEGGALACSKKKFAENDIGGP